MKISTGTLAFNCIKNLPQGMLEAQLRQLYYISDEIFITEGATKADGVKHGWDGDTTWCTDNGKSTDNTIDIIKSFPDPENKIVLIEKEGFWNGKTEMCNEWSKRATGDYIWQIDGDEFYNRKDVDRIKKMLEKYKPNAVHFYANHFWGDITHCIDETSGFGWGNDIPWKRIFKHNIGSKWISHEPPEYQLSDGKICNTSKVIPREEMLKIGIKMNHYSYINDEQVNFKSKFYKDDWLLNSWNEWKINKSCIIKNGSYTVPFLGKHPEFLNY